jgi:hypothetical protein
MGPKAGVQGSKAQNRKQPMKELIFIVCSLARIYASKYCLSPMGYHVESTFLQRLASRNS